MTHASAVPPLHNQGRRILLTAALPYANGALHVGHIAGAYLPCDIYARYLKSSGAELSTICGSDDHGVAMVLAGLKEDLSPAAVAEKYHEKQHHALNGMKICFDVYGATSRNEFHTELSQRFFLSLHKKGFFKKKISEQYFDASKNAFLPDRFVRGTCGFCNAPEQNGDQCEQCGKELDVTSLKDPRSVLSGGEVTLKETVHWFLDLSQFEPRVAAWLKDAVVREHTRSYVKGLLSQGLVERSMTRDLAWGIPVPLAESDAQGKVLYVWFDAPIGYISNTMQLCKAREGSPEHVARWWASPETEIYHFIGEDNTIFHTIIWIAMLAAHGEFSLPKGVVVNHFLNFQKDPTLVEKMSKSRGTALWVHEYLEQGGSPDVLRYYLTAIAPEESRSVFNPLELPLKNNSELGAIIGNLYQRVIQFTRTKLTPEVPSPDESPIRDVDATFLTLLNNTHRSITEDLEHHRFRDALNKAMDFGRACNKYLDETAPWKSIKSDAALTKRSLYTVFQGLKFLGIVLAPFLPDTAEKIATMLGLTAEERSWHHASLPYAAGRPLIEPQILFPRIEAEATTVA
jgi:methionyl-tRNA synthetase